MEDSDDDDAFSEEDAIEEEEENGTENSDDVQFQNDPSVIRNRNNSELQDTGSDDKIIRVSDKKFGKKQDGINASGDLDSSFNLRSSRERLLSDN